MRAWWRKAPQVDVRPSTELWERVDHLTDTLLDVSRQLREAVQEVRPGDVPPARQ